MIHLWRICAATQIFVSYALLFSLYFIILQNNDYRKPSQFNFIVTTILRGVTMELILVNILSSVSRQTSKDEKLRESTKLAQSSQRILPIV